MISFRNSVQLIKELASGVVHHRFPTSFNVVLPPVFDEDQVGIDIAEELGRHEPAPLVAVISADTVSDADTYIRELHRQWSETVRLPPVTLGDSTGIALSRLLLSLPGGRPAVQIVTRFHKILDSLDQWILGALRTAEQAHKLQSIVVAPFDYGELKRRWELRGKLLILSDYGDTHQFRTVDLLSVNEIESICQKHAIRRDIVKLALELTGGYPVPFNSVIGDWVRSGQPDLRPEVRRSLREVAKRRMRRAVDMLDLPGEARYRDQVINLHYGIDEEDALQVLSIHPWHSILIGEGELRAEALAHAAVDAAVRSTAERGTEVSAMVATVERAQVMYWRRRYAPALRLLECVDEGLRPDYVHVLVAHARVMVSLFASDDDEAGTDTDWTTVRKAIREAREITGRVHERIRTLSQIEARYRDLDGIASAISSAMEGGKTRVVDGLAKVDSEGKASTAKTALLLLLLKLEGGRVSAGHGSACQAVLALPEQIFRVWALWSLGLDYYKAPEGYDAIWHDVEESWPHGKLTRPATGEAFPSFASFAFFALAVALRNQQGDRGIVPDSSLKDLNRSLSMLQQVRNDHAHALSTTTAKMRKSVFEVIDRWFDALLPSCPAHAEAFSREELLALVEPLPVLDRENVLIWNE